MKLGGCAVFLHRIHHSDPIDVFHSHPWSWLSIIVGSYTEERPGCKPRIRRGVNLMHAGDLHRVDLHAGPVWTIFVHPRRRARWRVVACDGTTLAWEPWRGVDRPERTSYV